jgi:DNA-directed RNA polymerase subunit RPC12/RpoP
MLVAEADANGRLAPHFLSVKAEQIGPTHVRDVFSGQALSLHPLSAFFMKDPALCAIAGRFFATAAYGLALGRGQAALCGAYWDLVGAILSAARLYRQALDRQADGRGTRQRAGAEEAACSTPAGVSDALLLEEFASSRKVRCPACGGALQFRRYHSVGPDEESFPAEYACRACGRNVPRTIDRTDLEGWLRGEN